MIANLLKTDPAKRLTAEEALHHPWLAGVKVFFGMCYMGGGHKKRDISAQTRRIGAGLLPNESSDHTGPAHEISGQRDTYKKSWSSARTGAWAGRCLFRGTGNVVLNSKIATFQSTLTRRVLILMFLRFILS